MSLYVRIETSFYSHRKTLRLRAVIGDDAFWVPPRLWSYAAANQPDGNFADYTAQEIAALIDYRQDAQVMLEALLAVRFLDAGPIRIHDWHEYNGILDFFSKRAKKAADARWKKEKAKQIGAEQIKADQIRADQSIAYPSNASSIASSNGGASFALSSENEKPMNGKAGSLEEVRLFCAKSGIAQVDADWFWHKCEGNGWTNAGKKIKNWHGTLIAWKTAGYLPSQKHEHDQRNHKPTVSEIRNSHILGADASGSKAVAVIAARRERDEREAQARKAKAAGNGVATQVAGPGGDAP